MPGTGIYHAVSPVTDSGFSWEIHVGADVDTGEYLVVVLSKGRDGVYGRGYANLTAALADYNLTDETQDQVLTVLKDATINVAGSDDLMWIDHINVAPHAYLDVYISKNAVAPGESFEIYGNTSSDYVEIVAISPRGGRGTGIDGLYGVSIYTVEKWEGEWYNNGTNGSYKIIVFLGELITIGTEDSKTIIRLPYIIGDRFIINGTVNSNKTIHIIIPPVIIPPSMSNPANDFYKKIEVNGCADTGNYAIIVLSPGKDGVYGNSSYKYIDSVLDLDGAGPELGAIDVSNMTQDEIISAIKNATINQAGSDDLLEVLYLSVTGNVTENIFDTKEGTYPSISGTHNGTIKLKRTIEVSKIYTYPCEGTGGHTKYARIYNNSWSVETLPFEGYEGDWNNLSFTETFKLYANVEYNFTIITGSYPQIHHTKSLETDNGWINCTSFVDVNGRKYNDWIPAIKLYS